MSTIIKFDNYDRRLYEMLKPYRDTHVKVDGVSTLALYKYEKKIDKMFRPNFVEYAQAWGRAHNICVMMNSRAFLTLMMERNESELQELNKKMAEFEASKPTPKKRKIKNGN